MNKIKYILQTILILIVHTVISGSVLQTFMLEKGISENSVGLYFSVMQVVQILIILFLSNKADNIKNVIKSVGISFFFYIPFLLILIGSCAFEIKGLFVFLLVFGFIANVSIGFHSILSYKLPYHIMDMKNYGPWSGIAGICSGIFAFVFSLLLTFLQKNFTYISTMKYIYIIALILNIILSFVVFSFRRIDNHIKISKDSKKIPLLKYKPFLHLIIPNILRGFCLGIVSLAVTIGYFTNHLNSFSASILLIITQVSTILGCVVYTLFAGKERRLLLLCSIGLAATLPPMVLHDTNFFLTFYGIAYFFVTIINYAVPTAVVRLVDYEIAGQYNGGRMLLNTLGVFLSSLLCGTMLNTFGAFATLVIAGSTQLLSGIAYRRYLKKNKI